MHNHGRGTQNHRKVNLIKLVYFEREGIGGVLEWWSDGKHRQKRSGGVVANAEQEGWLGDNGAKTGNDTGAELVDCVGVDG